MSHTPGPWAIEKCPKAQAATDGRDWPWMVNYNDGEYEGHLALVQTQNAEANARLIAAAPELLESLKMMLEMSEMGGFGKAYAEDVARAAIAKATGVLAEGDSKGEERE